MRIQKSLVVACAVVAALATSAANAANISWTIVSSASSITLSLPTATISTSGLNVSLYPRNQGTTGSGGSWSVGNKQNLAGYISTDTDFTSYVDFLEGLGAQNFQALETGAVAPLANGDTGTAPAAYGLRIHARALFGITTGDISAAIRDVELGLNSPSLTVTAGSFAASGINVGIDTASLAYRGVGTIGDLIGSGSASIDNLVSANSKAGAGSIADLGGNLRQITIPVNIPVLIDLEGVVLNGTAIGQIVAIAVVPEPSTYAMMGIGLSMLAPMAVRRLRKRRA